MGRLRSILSDTSGQAIVLTALSFTVLAGLSALAIDTGIAFRAKRKMQIAADAAALAGTLDYLYNGSLTSAKTAARSASSLNGYTDGSNGVTVTPTLPPADGPNKGNSAFFEVIVSQPVGTFLMRVLGASTTTISARAVAGVPTAGQVCIWVMATSGASMNLQGSYDIEAPSCGIYVGSPASDAFSTTGSGGIVNTKFLDVVGNSPPSHQTYPTPTTVNAAPRKSPWGSLTSPNPSTGTGCDTVVTTSNLTLTGTMTGPGLGHTICYTQPVTLSNLTVGAGTLGTNQSNTNPLGTGGSVSSPAGTLVFGAGVTISGTVNIFGGTLDVASGSFSQPSNTLLNIIAPTSGTYNGLAVMQPASNTNPLQVQFGSNNQTLDGYIYAPGAQVSLHDSGGGVVATGVVAGTLYDKTSTIRIPSYDVANASTTPNRVVTLVE